MVRTSHVVLPMVAMLLLAAGCGGGLGIPTPADIFLPALEEAFPQPQRALEGSLSINGAGTAKLPLRVGDDANDLSWRGFTSFEMTVPAGRTLTRAQLRLHLGVNTGDPFGTLGLLFLERIDMGPTLDVADLHAAAVASEVGLSSAPMGLHDYDVTTLVQDALDRGLMRVDIRLRFGVSVVSDGVASLLEFTSYDVDTDPVSLPPTLALDWR